MLTGAALGWDGGPPTTQAHPSLDLGHILCRHHTFSAEFLNHLYSHLINTFLFRNTYSSIIISSKIVERGPSPHFIGNILITRILYWKQETDLGTSQLIMPQTLFRFHQVLHMHLCVWRGWGGGNSLCSWIMCRHCQVAKLSVTTKELPGLPLHGHTALSTPAALAIANLPATSVILSF